jgi:hypothetical protein
MMKKAKKMAVGGTFTSTPAAQPKLFTSTPSVAPAPVARTSTPAPALKPMAGTYGSSYKGLGRTMQNYLNSQQVGGAARFGYDPVGKNFRTMEGTGTPVFANMQQMKEAARGWKRAQRTGQEFAPNFKKGGKVSSASKRADGIATKGKTRGKIV